MNEGETAFYAVFLSFVGLDLLYLHYITPLKPWYCCDVNNTNKSFSMIRKEEPIKETQPYDLDINALGFHVNRVLWAMVKNLNRELKEHNLGIQHAEFIIIKALENIKGGSQSYIAQVLGKERSGISRSVAALEERGFIIKEAQDGKSNYVKLSEKGKSILPEINEIIDTISKQALKGFSKRSRESLINNLTRIYENSMEYSK